MQFLHDTALHLESVNLDFGLAEYFGMQSFKIHEKTLVYFCRFRSFQKLADLAIERLEHEGDALGLMEVKNDGQFAVGICVADYRLCGIF